MANTDSKRSQDTAAANRADSVRRAQRNARKRAALEAARKREAAKRRQHAWIGVGVAAVVVVVAVILVVSLTGSSPKKATAATPGASTAASTPPSAPPSAPATAAPAGPAFPGVPAGEAAALKTKPVVKAGTGTVTKLTVKTLIKGTGAAVKSGDSLVVNYVGVTYKDGKQFDASWDRSQTLPVVIGQGNVIKGWDQGLIGVPVGSRVQLDIPSDLAYGDTSTDGSPTGTLRFVVDVLSASPAS